MIRSKLCNKTSCDLVKSCLCRVDREAFNVTRDAIKLAPKELDHIGTRIQLPLLYHIGLYQSPASESFIIHRYQGNSLLHQMGIDMAQESSQQHNSVLKANKPTAVQLSIVLLKLREQVKCID